MGIREDRKNYRGISLINTGYRVYAEIMYHILKTTGGNIIGYEQCGIKTGRSNSNNIFTFYNVAMNKNGISN